jgi:hypothetical protein
VRVALIRGPDLNPWELAILRVTGSPSWLAGLEEALEGFDIAESSA